MWTATHRFARISPRKVRLVIDLIRGQRWPDALGRLRFNLTQTREGFLLLERLEQRFGKNSAADFDVTIKLDTSEDSLMLTAAT